jgi:hypothetical protein
MVGGETDECSAPFEVMGRLVFSVASLGSGQKRRPGFSPWALPLLGSNQDSPDPEGPLKHPEFQQLATVYASSCHPMLEFAGLHAVLCRTLLTQMSEFAATIFHRSTP